MKSFKFNAFSYATIVALGGFIFGLDAALISGTVKFITQEFSLSDIEIGMAVSAPGFGVLFALPLAGIISNKYGRKKALLLVALLYMVSAISSALATSFIALVAARFLGGLAFCSLSLASMYIGEIAPAKWRGKLVSMNQINIVVGLSAAYFINYFIVNSLGSGAGWVESIGLENNIWRWMLGSEIIPAIIWFVLLFMIPESPSWYVYQSRSEDAKKVLRKIIPEEEIDEKIVEMEESMNQSESGQSIISQLKELFTPKLRTTLFIGVTIAAVQQVCGINAILFYAPTVFEQLGLGTDAAFLQATWIGLVGFAFTVLAILLIDRLGRRPMTIWGLAWIMLSLGICAYGFNAARYTLTQDSVSTLTIDIDKESLTPLLGVEYESDTEFKQALTGALGEADARNYSSELIQSAAVLNTGLILFGILSFIAAFHFSIGPITWVLFSEIFPISLRGIAIPSFAFITSITSYLVQQFFPWQLSNMGVTFVFLSYAIMVGVGLVILYKYLPETKNMTIEEIQQKLEVKQDE